MCMCANVCNDICLLIKLSIAYVLMFVVVQDSDYTMEYILSS